MSVKLYQPNWSWNDDTDKWLKNMCVGYTLNFPCGMSKVGDVRADLDPTTNPDFLLDLTQPKTWGFQRGQFDTIICDPPFNMLSDFSRNKFIHVFSDLARKRIIFSLPLVDIKISSRIWNSTYYITKQSSAFFIRLWQVLDRINSVLDEPSCEEGSKIEVLERGTT